MKRGLFVGLVTLDLVYRISHPPAKNQKIVASDSLVSAGGPATNAAVAFNHLGNQAIVLGVVGSHPLTQLILADLRQCGVILADLDPTRTESPSVSSIMVTEATGERAVVSMNGIAMQVSETSIPVNCLQDIDIVFIDGHQMAVGRAIAAQAKAQGIPVIVDGGSWKSGFETVLPFADAVIASANFQPPDCQSVEETVAYLSALGIPQLAITRGQKPIQYWAAPRSGQIDVPTIQAVDTLGAGDIFHGAFCHAILQADFVNALAIAANIAAHSCQFFGTRRWMTDTAHH